MKTALRFFVRRHLLVNVLACALVVLGVLSASQLQREFIPSVETPVFWITALLPGASARDVETKVVIPVEEALDGVAGVDETFTVISDNTALVTVEVYEGLNELELASVQRDIRAALDSITDFPDDMEDAPTLEQFNPARSAVIEVALSGPEAQVALAADALEKRLERLPSIAGVVPVGVGDAEARVLVDPDRSLAHRITLLDLVAAIRARNVSSTGGALESAADRRQVVMWSRYEAPEDVADTVLRFQPHGAGVRVRDVARVEVGREDTGVRVHVAGQAGALLVVSKQAAADIIDAVHEVREVVQRFPLPDGVTARFTGDESWIIGNRLQMLATNGAVGAVLVALVLFVFVRPKPAAWVLVGIPVVFLGALALFSQTGMSLNMVSLTGFVIALGMVVDDAVVVAERITFRQAHGSAPADAAVLGTAEMARPVTAAALTTVLAFLPLAFLGGRPGDIVWEIPAVVVMVMLLSLAESFLILPAHMSTVRTAVAGKRPLVLRLEAVYRQTLRVVMRNRWLTLALAGAALLSALVLVRPLVPFVLYPQDDADRLFVKITAPHGASVERTAALASALALRVGALVETDLDLVTARIGHQSVTQLNKTYGDAENEAVLVVQLHRHNRRRTNAEWMDVLARELEAPEGVRLHLSSEYFGPPVGQPVTVHVIGNDDEARRAKVLEVTGYLENQTGVVEIDVDERPGTPRMELNVNEHRLALRDLDATVVGATLAAAFHGLKATEHRDLERTTEIRVMFDPGARRDLEALLDTPVRTRGNALVPLVDVVDPVEVPGVGRIYHRNGERAATVTASFTPESGHTASSFAAKLEAELFPRLSGGNVTVRNGGEAAETAETTGAVGVAAVLAVTGIAVVIWLTLGSLLQVAIVMLAVPFAVAGVFVVFFAHGKPMSLFAVLGAVGLVGVVVNAAIVMVDAVNRRLARAPAGAAAEALIVEAAVERLRPVLVTTLTTLVGVFPTAYGLGGYDAVVSVISLAIGWGLVPAALVSLFVIPVLLRMTQP